MNRTKRGRNPSTGRDSHLHFGWWCLNFSSAYLCDPLRLCGLYFYGLFLPQRRRGSQRYAEGKLRHYTLVRISTQVREGEFWPRLYVLSSLNQPFVTFLPIRVIWSNNAFVVFLDYFFQLRSNCRATHNRIR